MVLVDTSVWVEHLRRPLPALVGLLTEEKVATHWDVIGELACGGLVRRPQSMTLLRALPRIRRLPPREVIAFIEQHQLDGEGPGWFDFQLLAACVVDRAGLWTFDRRLNRVAARFCRSYREE